MQLLARNEVKEFTYEDLQLFTNDFSQENFIGRTQLGKLYRAKIQEGWKGMEAQEVTVKMWQNTTVVRKDDVIYTACPNEIHTRMRDEINFLNEPSKKNHPNLAKVKGYCEDQQLGVVFNLKPLNTIRNLVLEGNFDWLHRVRVALELARLLKFLHGHQPRYLLRNLSAAHIILDQEYNPILVDFAMLIGGPFGDRRKAGTGCPLGSYGYSDVKVAYTGIWTEETDVFCFGIILLELICKCVVDCIKYFKQDGSALLHNVAQVLYGREKSKFRIGKFKYSLASKSFKEDPSFDIRDGNALTKLAIRCVDYSSKDPRPSIPKVVEKLEKLHVVRNNSNLMGIPETPKLSFWCRVYPDQCR